MGKKIVYGGFDNITSSDIRFLHEASKQGPLHALLWTDEAIEKVTGSAPKFPLAERKYYMDAIRFVDTIEIVDRDIGSHMLPVTSGIDTWIIAEKDDSPEKKRFCKIHNIDCKVLTNEQLTGFPILTEAEITRTNSKKVIVTGCYDWFHTGHVRFFEEVSELGDLYVCMGNDANIEQLKGKGHPLIKEDERRYMVQAIRFVTQSLINSGFGWMDAEPEIERIKPDIYAVNEDGDKPEKKEYCEKHGIEYVVLKRTPAPGLPKRDSTALRGF